MNNLHACKESKHVQRFFYEHVGSVQAYFASSHYPILINMMKSNLKFLTKLNNS